MPNRVLLALSKQRRIQRLITGAPLTRKVAERFVAGDTLEEAIAAVKARSLGGVAAILDHLGENITDDATADIAADAYLETLDAIAEQQVDSHVSVKLTQLGLDLGIEGCVARMQKVCARAAEVGTTVAIDMESHIYTDRTIETYRRLRGSHDNLILCLQAYLKRTEKDVELLQPLNPSIRLCKGAYDEPKEISLRRTKTREAFRRILLRLFENDHTAVATHDEALINFARGLVAAGAVDASKLEFQMLYGVRRELQSELVAQGYRVRVYIPFGREWYPYLMRRLAERPANLRFFMEAVIRG